MQRAFYSEWEPFCAGWLRNLISDGMITPGVVDERDVRQITPEEVEGYPICHFFAGITPSGQVPSGCSSSGRAVRGRSDREPRSSTATGNWLSLSSPPIARAPVCVPRSTRGSRRNFRTPLVLSGSTGRSGGARSRPRPSLASSADRWFPSPAAGCGSCGRPRRVAHVGTRPSRCFWRSGPALLGTAFRIADKPLAISLYRRVPTDKRAYIASRSICARDALKASPLGIADI